MPPAADSFVAPPTAPTAIATASVSSSSTIADAKIGDLPRYREMIIAAIRSNPCRRAKYIAGVMLSDYAVKVNWDALRVYIDREGLYDAAVASPSTPMRPTGAPSTPTGAAMQASPVRTSPRQKVYAKIGDLPRYKKRIVDAIKANPGKRERKLAGVLETDYALVVNMLH